MSSTRPDNTILEWDSDGYLLDIRRSNRCPAGFFDCDDRPLVPQFVDQHFHGSGRRTVADKGAWEGIIQALLASGTGLVCFSTLAMPLSQLVQWLQDLAGFRSFNSSPQALVGAHIEGQFISQDFRGAHDGAHVVGANLSVLQQVLSQIPVGIVRHITIDPSSSEAPEFTRFACAQGIRIALGHTGASLERALEIVECGATGVTHMFNAMAPLSARSPGLLGLAMSQPVYFEIIPNEGLVHPVSIALLLKVAGPDRVICVSDAVSASSFGGVQLGSGGRTYVGGTTVLGSARTLPQMTGILREVLGGSVTDLVRLTSENARSFLGLDTRWPPKEGQTIDALLLSRDWQVDAIIRSSAVRPISVGRMSERD